MEKALINEHGEGKPYRWVDGISWKWFIHEGARYTYDVLARDIGGWSQFPTREDAWYFGVWVNHETREMIQYAEGDLLFGRYNSQKAWNEIMGNLRGLWPETPPAARGIEANGALIQYYDEDDFHGRAKPT